MLGLAPMKALLTCRWPFLVVILAAVLGIHFFAASITIRNSNQDSNASDQGAEMWLAQTSREDIYPQRTDGVRHPLFSWIARATVVDDHAEFFARGKWLNTALCLAFLTVLGIAAARFLDPLALANLLFLSSLGILLVRGAYFQPEPLYYIAFFASALLAWRILRDPDPEIWHYAVFGILLGIAFLSKPSLAPFLVVFCGALALRIVIDRFTGEPGIPWRIPGVLGAFLILAAMITPLGIFSYKHFGKPFFNYPKIWMWMDDFDTEAWPWQTKYPGRTQLEALTRDQIPSASNYFKKHTAADASKRLFDGIDQVKTRFLFPESKLRWHAFLWKTGEKRWEQPLAHRGIYLIALAALVVILAAFSWRDLPSWFTKSENISCAALVIGTAIIYLSLYGWYWPIGRGDRFMGSLWIPSVFLLVAQASNLLKSPRVGILGERLYLAAHAVILLSLILQSASLLWLLTHGVYLTTRN